MRVIGIENKKTLLRNSLVLLLLGMVCAVFGWLSDNPATTVLGTSFGLLTIVGYLLVLQDRPRFARLAWALGTPVLIFFSPVFFNVSQVSAVLTYSYFYIGGLVFTVYYLPEKEERWIKWTSISLYFLGLMAYDRVIVEKNFAEAPYLAVLESQYLHLKTGQVIHFVSLVYLLLLVQANRDLIQQELASRIHKLTAFTDNILSYGRSKVLVGGDLLPSLKEVLVKTHRVVDVSRISVWEYLPDSESISLVVAYDTLTHEYAYEQQLFRKELPVYFQHLLDEKILAVDEADVSPKTKEFSSGYLREWGIKSMLDTPFFVQGTLKGILCFEEQRTYRKWDEVDLFFSMALSKLISICYYGVTIQQQYQELKQLTDDLKTRNQDLSAINHKVMEINGQLENQLEVEQESLKEIRDFLEKLPFKNAHEIRGPLSRILTLVNHYRSDPNPENHEFSLTHIESAASEIDSIVKEIAHILAIRQRDEKGGKA